MSRAQRLSNVLWPSFIAAGAATIVFFTMFDPMELQILGHHVDVGRMAAYSVGFFGFWVLGAVSSGLTCFFQRTAAEINRCPLPPVERPSACPKREDPTASC
jgi:hypothetical protein